MSSSRGCQAFLRFADDSVEMIPKLTLLDLGMSRREG
jgi:hypothetical protein